MSNQIEHTPECVARQAALDHWLKRWPNYCKVCGGRPVFVYPATREQPEEQDWCEACIAASVDDGDLLRRADVLLHETGGFCPRCMCVIRVDPPAVCLHCGWNWGKGKDDFPPEVDCWCFEQMDEYANATLGQIFQDDSLHFGTNWQSW